MPGPNDHHFAKNTETGALEQKPGLGEFEPSEKGRLAAAKEEEAIRLREEALARASADIKNEAAALEQRQAEFDRREAELREREERLNALERRSPDQDKAIETGLLDGALPDADRRKLATDRPGA